MSRPDWEMVFEYIDNETGAMFNGGRSTRHGWDSPEHAITDWTKQGRFAQPGIERYRNGKSEKRNDYTLRTYFEPANGEPSESTRTVANMIRDYARARKTTDRETLFAYGAELALIASLMLANVAQAVDIATAEIHAEGKRNGR